MQWCAKLEEAEKREIELKEKIRDSVLQEEQWRKQIKEEQVRQDEWSRRVEEALRRGAEQEKERSKVEIEEYREQVQCVLHAFIYICVESC